MNVLVHKRNSTNESEEMTEQKFDATYGMNNTSTSNPLKQELLQATFVFLFALSAPIPFTV
jgi:hypothetical protein